jgi:hypothetical protein
MTNRRHAAKMLALSLCATLALGGTLGTAVTDASSRKAPTRYTQPSCGALKAKAKSKKGSRDSRRRATLGYEECRDNRKAYDQIRDSYFVGTRADGVAIDTLYCSNGKVRDDVSTAGARTFTKGWRVVGAKFAANGKDFTAVAETLESVTSRQVSTFVLAFAWTDGRWQVGYADSNDEPGSPGDVVRTSAREACATL